MYSFLCDYSEGAHPSILNAIVKTNFEQTDGYGIDPHCENAAELIKKHIKNLAADVHFLVGGTQTNMTAISAFLRPHQSVISAATGHINVHETGAIEFTGHKIQIYNTSDGKLSPKEIQMALDEHEDEHMTMPKLVYISNSTEIGSIYSKDELQALSHICKKNGLFLYMDGARLASALASQENDLSFSDISSMVDAFYIGGTKNGALFGEALVICNDTLKEDFRYHIKQKGGLLAKGRLLGIQFEEFFSENLYIDIAIHTNKMAKLLRDGFLDFGCSFLTHSPSNQIFPIVPNYVAEALSKNYKFYVWKKIDEETCALRLVTSWATEEKYVIELVENLKKLKNK